MYTRIENSVREALAGLSLLLVGGEASRHHEARLLRDLALANVVHRPTRRSNPSAGAFLSALAEPQLVLVVCARGLCRTSHGSTLHRECRERELPLLDCFHLPHPNALVAAVVRERLVDGLLARARTVRARDVRGGAA